MDGSGARSAAEMALGSHRVRRAFVPKEAMWPPLARTQCEVRKRKRDSIGGEVGRDGARRDGVRRDGVKRRDQVKRDQVERDQVKRDQEMPRMGCEWWPQPSVCSGTTCFNGSSSEHAIRGLSRAADVHAHVGCTCTRGVCMQT